MRYEDFMRYEEGQVGMKVVYNEQGVDAKPHFTFGKEYVIERMAFEKFAVRNDRDRICQLFPRRFKMAENQPVAAQPELPFQVGDEVHFDDWKGAYYIIHEWLPNGNVTLKHPGADFIHRNGGDGYKTARLTFREGFVRKPKKIPGVFAAGDRVIVRKPDNVHAWPYWGGDMDRFEGEQVVANVFDANAGRAYVTIEADRDGYHFNVKWLTHVEGAAAIIEPAKPKREYKAGDIVKIVKKAGKWREQMDETIGEVVKLKKRYDYGDGWEADNGWIYVEDSFGEASEEEVAKKKKPLNFREQLAELRTKAEKKVKGNCSYVIFVKDEKGLVQQIQQFGDICHYRIQKNAHYGGKERVWQSTVGLIDFLHDYKKAIPEAMHTTYRRYVDYIVNRSPWSVAFQNKTVKNVLDNGVLYKVDQPASVIAGACIALRFGKEYQMRLPIFAMLLKEGVHESAAALAMYAFHPQADGFYARKDMNGGHMALSGDTAAGSMFEFFASGYDEKVFKENKPYAEDQRYKVFDTVKQCQNKLKLKEKFNDFVRKNVKMKEVGQGWDSYQAATKEQVIEFAKLLEIKINEAKAA